MEENAQTIVEAQPEPPPIKRYLFIDINLKFKVVFEDTTGEGGQKNPNPKYLLTLRAVRRTSRGMVLSLFLQSKHLECIFSAVLSRNGKHSIKESSKPSDKKVSKILFQPVPSIILFLPGYKKYFIRFSGSLRISTPNTNVPSGRSSIHQREAEEENVTADKENLQGKTRKHLELNSSTPYSGG